MIGIKHIKADHIRWKQAYKKSGLIVLNDTRQTNSERRLN